MKSTGVTYIYLMKKASKQIEKEIIYFMYIGLSGAVVIMFVSESRGFEVDTGCTLVV